MKEEVNHLFQFLLLLLLLQMAYLITGGSLNTCVGVQCNAVSAAQLPEGYLQFVQTSSSGIYLVSLCGCMCLSMCMCVKLCVCVCAVSYTHLRAHET